MNVVWILVCDSARGRLFETRGNAPSWDLLEVFSHAESRSKASELTSDRMGQSMPQGAVRHGALAPSTNPKDVEKGHFVHTLATMLDKGLRSNRFDRLVLVAPPHCLGMLKNELTTELQKHLMATVDKDLTHCDAADLGDRLGDTVRIPAAERLASENKASKHAH